MIAAGLRLIQRHATWALIGGGLLGLLAPPLAEALRPLLIPSILALLVLSLTIIDGHQLRITTRRPLFLAIAVSWLMLGIPLLMFGLILLLEPSDLWRQILILTAAAPPILSVAAFAQIVGLGATLALSLMVVATFVLPLTLLPLAALILGMDISAELSAFLLRTVGMLGLPTLLAWGIRRLLPPATHRQHARELGGLGVICLAVFAIALMDGATERLLEQPLLVGAMLLVAFAMNLGWQLASYLPFSLVLNRAEALTLALCAGNRNMGLMLALTVDMTHPAFVTYVAVYQIPVFCIPLFQKPLVERWLATTADDTAPEQRRRGH